MRSRVFHPELGAKCGGTCRDDEVVAPRIIPDFIGATFTALRGDDVAAGIVDDYGIGPTATKLDLMVRANRIHPV
jgi:hypothetical protein